MTVKLNGEGDFEAVRISTSVHGRIYEQWQAPEKILERHPFFVANRGANWACT
jgi:hypothetical protein